MLKNITLISLLFYLISCTSNDNGIVQDIPPVQAIPVNISTPKVDVLSIDSFNHFLSELSSYQMVAAGDIGLHNKVQNYLPDSTISEGFDLHIHEIGRIDSFRLVFHEYFDIYDDWSKTYFNVFSSTGLVRESKKLWELSFEGNISINAINQEIVEIAYHDIFDKNELFSKSIIPEEQLFLTPLNSQNDQYEGTIYEYYKLDKDGKLQEISRNKNINKNRNYPQASAKLFSKSELLTYSEEELKLMKEEILAYNGYIFEDIQALNYYKMQNWYKPISKNLELLLTDIERINLQLISNLETAY